MEDFVALTPINFFQISLDCYQVERSFPKVHNDLRKYLLPDLSSICVEAHFAQVAMGWNVDGIEVYVAVNQPLQRVIYPDVTRGDSVELFFDTRDVKTSGFNTRFCHHFFFLPEAVEGVQAGKITRFRTEDAHPLANSEEIELEAYASSQEGKMKLFLPSSVLTGWNPAEFDRLGFSYRLNRRYSDPLHFSAKTQEYALEQEPSLWASCKLQA